MGYVTTGRTHHSGVKAETVLADQLNSGLMFQFFPDLDTNDTYVAEQVGGTRALEDVVVKNSAGNVVKKISLKNKESDSGSFDWKNNSSIVKNIPCLAECKELLDEDYKQSYMDVEVARSEIKELLNIALLDLTVDDLELFFNTIFPKYNGYTLAVYQQSEQTYYIIDSIPTLPAVSHIDLAFDDTKASARIIFEGGLDLGFRIRLTLNNGVTALVSPKPGKNKASTLALKLQQDKIFNTFLPYAKPRTVSTTKKLDVVKIKPYVRTTEKIRVRVPSDYKARLLAGRKQLSQYMVKYK